MTPIVEAAWSSVPSSWGKSDCSNRSSLPPMKTHYCSRPASTTMTKTDDVVAPGPMMTDR